MVNRGASRGCVTCRQRRVKCDETKPFCRACLRLGLECAGYVRPRLRFKDESLRYLGKQRAQATRVDYSNQHLTRTIPNTNTIPPFPSHSPQDLAVPFFLTYITDVGRSMESTRGFLEFVRPVLASEPPSSALSAAVNAVAVKVWTMIGYNHVCDSLPTQLLCQALVLLRQATNDPEERARDATVLAALVLQMHDTLSAVSGQSKAHGMHRDGALALLLQRDDSSHGSKYHAYLVGNLLHSRVSRAVRTSNALPSTELRWVKSQVIPVLPMNPSSLLDMIGVSIASIQHDFCDPSLTLCARPSRLQDLSERVQRLENQLQNWLEGVPALWIRRRIQSGKDIDPSIETYYDACDIYPSIQIVNIWNTWRIYRLVLEQAKSRLRKLLALSWNGASSTQNDMHGGDATREVEELVDSICYSIPFYLGNCTRPGILLNMQNPRNKFPSYHDLSPNDEAFLNYKSSDEYVSRFDHSCHVNLHGPLHVMSILSQLIGIFDQKRNSGEAFSLREDQAHWMAGQLIRSLYLMNMTPGCSSKKTNSPQHENYDSKAIDRVSLAGTLADKFKKELWTITVS